MKRRYCGQSTSKTRTQQSSKLVGFENLMHNNHLYMWLDKYPCFRGKQKKMKNRPWLTRRISLFHRLQQRSKEPDAKQLPRSYWYVAVVQDIQQGITRRGTTLGSKAVTNHDICLHGLGDLVFFSQCYESAMGKTGRHPTAASVLRLNWWVYQKYHGWIKPGWNLNQNKTNHR